MRRSLFAVSVVVAFTACRSIDPGLPPAEVRGLPWSDTAADRLALSARRAVERGEPLVALRQLTTILRNEPNHVDANRLRQDVLRQRGRRGLLVREARQRLREHPEDGLSHYLLARVTDDPQEKLRGFARAAERSPDSLWPWLGLAHTLIGADLDRSLRIYERLYAASAQHPLVAIAYAAALRSAEQFEAAQDVYLALRGDRRVAGVGELGVAQVAASQGRQAAVAGPLLEALRLRPFDPGVQRLVHGMLASQEGNFEAGVLDALREDGDRMQQFADGDGAGVLASLLQRRGQSLAASHVLERYVDAQPSPTSRRMLRRARLAVGDVAGFLQMLGELAPEHVVAAEDNQLRGRWLRLLRGPWRDGELADAEAAGDLLRAMRDVGLLAEIELLAEALLARWPDDGRLQRLQSEARRELAFESGLRELIYLGYQQGDVADLQTVLARLRELSRRVLGRDVVGAPPVFSVPLVGEMLDPFEGPLARHLARYNRHMVLGRRAGGTAEAMLVTRLSLVELPEAEELPLVGRCYEVVGIDRDVKALAGVLGGDLAGVALLNHFLIDYDAVVDWADGLRRRRRIAREDDGALLRDPLPETPGDSPLDAAWRLAVQSPVADDDLTAAVLDMIRHHERQHLVDSFYYLPIENNLWRGLGLLFEFGLSPSAIEAEMERRAELAALAVSEHTELVLAHIVDFYGDPPVHSPHHVGFSALADELRAALLELGVDAAQAHPSRWHELDMALVRRAARSLLDRLPNDA